MDVGINITPSFGWSKNTHYVMTKKALEKNKKLNFAEHEAFANYTMLPDEIKSEKGYYNNTHFYFQNGKTKSFGKDPEKNNALAKFTEHYKKSFKADSRRDFLYEVAFALHFLQDANTPVHTEQSSFIVKFRDYYLHKNFERGEKYGAASKHTQFLKNFKPQKIDFLKLDDLFIKTAEFSSQDKYKVSRFNKSKWENIQQECFNYGVSASKEFVDFMMKFLPKK